MLVLAVVTIPAANISCTLQVRVSVAALATMCARPVAVSPWCTTQGNSEHWSNSSRVISTLLPAVKLMSDPMKRINICFVLSYVCEYIYSLLRISSMTYLTI